MPISRDEVMKIADLARLHFSEAELEAFTVQFQRILEYVEQLEQVDVAGIEPTSHVSLSEGFEECLFRDDDVKPSLSVEDSLANAPESGQGQFKVPKVI